ncbi:MAG: glycosyltransferase family 25 protein [Rhodobacteraceae bacterium]|nr:glycosyltransferase family 25 protein [Paracoccaceae bacterium]
MPLPVFVISLPDSHARRAAISDALGKLGLAFEFVDAVDGRSGLPADQEPCVDRQAAAHYLGRPMSDAELATALSHVLVHERFLASAHEHALILEDDAVPTPDLIAFLDGKGYTAAPLVLLHHLGARVLPHSGTRVAETLNLRPLAVPCFRATAYTLSRGGAEWLLERTRPVSGTADWPADITRLPAMVVDPQIVHHPRVELGQSTIAPGRATRGGHRWHRFLDPSYARRVWRKMRSERIS